jgi:hypothetical protein
MSEDQIQTITDACFHKHAAHLETENASHLKKMRRNLQYWVTLPVGLLVGLGLFLVSQMFVIGTTVAEFKAETSIKVDFQSRGLMDETRIRSENNIEIKNELEKIEQNLERNLQWLYQNCQFKDRGTAPYIPKSQPKGTPK